VFYTSAKIHIILIEKAKTHFWENWRL